MMGIFFRGLAFALLAVVARAAPLRILAIGDSMSEEYAFEVPFSAPDSNPTNANVRNWPELLRIHRATEATLGTYESSAAGYSDLRNAGHRLNFGVPGFTTSNWITLLNTTSRFPIPNEPLGVFYYDTRNALQDELPLAEVVVILLGANDLKQDYNDIFNGTEAAGYYNGIVNRLSAIHQFVRTRRPAVPIVLCTIPDVGATPDISATYNDPVKRAAARVKIAALNQSIINLAATNGAAVARLDHLTDRVFNETPFQLNGTVFTAAGAPENPPDRLFCKDNFHPATVSQALIANEILAACTAATARPLALFGNREILQLVLGLDPDAPYKTWAAAWSAPVAPQSDDDGDGVPNLVEFTLGTSPRQNGFPWTFSVPADGTVSVTPSPEALRYASLTVLESGDLVTWQPVPSARITTNAGGAWSIAPSGADRGFYRLRADVRN